MNRFSVLIVLLTACLAQAGRPADDRQSPFWWQKATASPAYTKATAWAPRFDDKALWPQLTGKEDYLKQDWSEGRLYVWRNPGRNGDLHARRRDSLDPTEPSNWLRDGKPAKELILDEKTDLLFPASEKPYRVGFRTTPLRPVFRHVTVESGAHFVGGGDGKGRTIYGNVWVKKGGHMYAQGSTTFVGSAHRFFRNDNASGGGSQYFSINIGDGGSVEVLGCVTTSDEWKFYRGTFIVGPDSQMLPGRAAAPFMQEGTRLVLLDGAYWGKWCNEWVGPLDLHVRGATIQAGLPERPLTRDCTLALSIRNWSGLEFAAWSGDGKDFSRRKVSAVFETGSTIRTIAANGSDAALVITRYEVDGPFNGNGRAYMHHIGEYGRYPNQSERRQGLFADPKFRAEFDSEPHKTLAYFAKDVAVEGPVRFEHFAPGGLLCEDPSVRAAWKDVSFGESNLAGPERMFTACPDIGKRGEIPETVKIAEGEQLPRGAAAPPQTRRSP